MIPDGSTIYSNRSTMTLANTHDNAVPTVEQADADERRSRTAATRIGIAAVVVAEPAPTTSARPASPMPPSPTMRAPISVEPEPHPPFPNQNAPSGNDDQGGGLLGGLF
jgi:hypothetical protein